jgi:DNA-binding transcriptional ArsR family regulator
MTPLPHLFAALSDPTRFGMVERLLAEGELSVARLREGIEISAPAVSRHLNVLAGAGIVARRARGTQRLYSVRPEALREIGGWAMDHREFWGASLDRLETALLQEDPKE